MCYFIYDILSRQTMCSLILWWTEHQWGAEPLQSILSATASETGKASCGLAPTCSPVRPGSLWGRCNSQASQSKSNYNTYNVFLKGAKTNSKGFLMPRFAFSSLDIHWLKPTFSRTLFCWGRWNEFLAPVPKEFRTNLRLTFKVTKDKPSSFESAENIESLFLSEHVPDPCRCQGAVLSLAYRVGAWMLM